MYRVGVLAKADMAGQELGGDDDVSEALEELGVIGLIDPGGDGSLQTEGRLADTDAAREESGSWEESLIPSTWS